MRMLLLGLFGLALLTVSTAVFAANAVDCARIDDDSDRLDCYDSLFRPPPEASAERLGAEQLSHSEAREAVPEPELPRELVSTIVAIDRRALGEHTFTLANGQKWTQKEVDPKKRFRIGDAVTIKRLSFGSYMLTTARGISSRVKRLE